MLLSVRAVGVVGGQSRLLAVVAVGESGEVVGSVGGDGGGGWKGTIVGCLLTVDNNKSTKQASANTDARFGCR